MGKRLNFVKKLVEKSFEYSIHISLLAVAVAVIFGDLFFFDIKEFNTAWAELTPVEKVDAKKADFVLNYLTKIAPPLSDGEEGQQGSYGFLSAEDGSLSRPTLLNTVVSGLARDNITTYKISEGESYWTIAYKFEITIDTLRWVNNIDDINKIKPGQELVIPPANGLVHTVKDGDDLDKIAQLYGIDKNVIAQKNKLADASIAKDQQLFIPGARKYTKPNFNASVPASAYGYNFWDGPIQNGSGSFIWPIRSSGRFITQYFTWVTKYYKHTGIDMDWRNGTDIIASDAGTVVAVVSGWGGGYGNHIIIDHGNGYQTLYGHIAKSLVNVGQNVSAGQSIAVMGNTGRSTGQHLHFEIRYDGVALNPLAYVK